MYQALLPYLGVFVGWLLHEISDLIRRSREDRRLAGKVLAELLELRHSLLALRLTLRELRKRLLIPEEAEPLFRTIFSPMIAKLMAELPERYNRAIDSAAGAFPILAFELRSKEKIGLAFDQIRAFASGDAQAVAVISQVEESITEKLVPVLDDLALRLGRLHGLRTWLQVRRKLKKADEVPPEISDLIDSLIKRAQVAGSPGQAPGS